MTRVLKSLTSVTSHSRQGCFRSGICSQFPPSQCSNIVSSKTQALLQHRRASYFWCFLHFLTQPSLTSPSSDTPQGCFSSSLSCLFVTPPCVTTNPECCSGSIKKLAERRDEQSIKCKWQRNALGKFSKPGFRHGTKFKRKQFCSGL